MPSPALRRFQCRHIFTDGHRCGSPCLKGEDFCYYHHTTRRPHRTAAHDPYNEPPNQTSFTLPTPEDPSAIQHAIGEIMNQLSRNALDPRRAGLLLYALQIASLNLRQAGPHALARSAEDTVEEVTLDPVLGPLAPLAEVGDNCKSSRGTLVLQRWLDELEEEQGTGKNLSLQAVAAPKYPRKPCRLRTLARKYPRGSCTTTPPASPIRSSQHIPAPQISASRPAASYFAARRRTACHGRHTGTESDQRGQPAPAHRHQQCTLAHAPHRRRRKGRALWLPRQ